MDTWMMPEHEAQKRRAVIEEAVRKLRKLDEIELASELKDRSELLP